MFLKYREILIIKEIKHQNFENKMIVAPDSVFNQTYKPKEHPIEIFHIFFKRIVSTIFEINFF